MLEEIIMAIGTSKVTFRGADGDALAARLDRPEGAPKAFALFAHCFTCSKDIFAAQRIAGALAERGFGVLRFDFTGLGSSEGEFANTNFSSNVGDLVAAADFLRTEYEAPKILIGHSLGGAAVLAAAGRIAEVKAIATIGAPADPSHVNHLFVGDIAEIEAAGEARVKIAGRSFTIKKQFIEDIREQNLSAAIGDLGKALLIFHGPRDQTVAIDDAAVIFTAAKHPKSFISLDDADHLLSRKEDAIYVADVLAAWAGRYLDAGAGEPAAAEAPAGPFAVTVAETGAGRFSQAISAGKHRLVADEPEAHGGNDTGPTPYDLLLAALGACTTMTLRIYAERKGWEIKGIRTALRHEKIHARDCEDCETTEGRIDRIEREISFTADVDGERRARLLEIADKCPVHRTLTSEVDIVTRLAG